MALNGVLDYGKVSIHMSPLFETHEIFTLPDNIAVSIVDRVELADGIVILSRDARQYKSQCVLFTQYKYRSKDIGRVDHALSTLLHLQDRKELRRDTLALFTHEIRKRSFTASVAFSPRIEYFDRY